MASSSKVTTSRARTSESGSAGCISLRGVRPIDEDQKVTTICHPFLCQLSDLEIAGSDTCSTVHGARTHGQEVFQVVRPEYFLGDRITYDPTRGESEYSLKTAEDFRDEVIDQVLRPREDQQPPESTRAYRDIEITHFKPGSSVATALHQLTSRGYCDMQKGMDRIQNGYDNYPSKNDFHLKFVSLEEFTEAHPPISEDEFDAIPPSVNVEEHHKYLQDKWGDATIGDWSKIPQPEDGRLFISVFRSGADITHGSDPVSMEEHKDFDTADGTAKASDEGEFQDFGKIHMAC